MTLTYQSKWFFENIVILIAVSVPLLHNPHIAEPLAVLVIISLVFCVSILNYLSHRKIKDPKIIYQTVILDISVMVLFFIVEFIIRNKG